ncbi:MAG: GumC family protein [Spirulinaceae cyanobacterium]
MTSPLVKRFLVSLNENSLIGFFTFLFVVGASGLVAMLPPPEPTPPTYRARGLLRFQQPSITLTDTGENLSRQGKATVDEKFLKSDAVLRPVVEELEIEPQNLIDKLQIQFNEPEGEEDTGPTEILLQYENPEEGKAERALEIMMERMVEQSRSFNTSVLRARIGSLQERITQVKQDLQGAEQAYYRYITEKGSSLVAAEDGTLFSGISGAQQQQREIRLTLEGVESQIQSISSQLGMTPDQAYTASALSADPLVANLRSQLLEIETQIATLEDDLRPQHPKMQELLNTKAANEELLQQRVGELIGTGNVLVPLPGEIRQTSSLDPARRELANTLVKLQTDRETLISQLESVQKTERELRQQYEQFPAKQLERGRLQQELQTKQTLYNQLLGQLLDAQAAEAETVGSLSIGNPAFAQEIEGTNPEATSPIIIIGGGGVLGFIAAAGAIFLLSVLDNRLHTAKEIKDILSDREVAFLGELPFVFNLNRDREEVPIVQTYNLGDLHYFELFRTNLQRGAAKSAKVILITSLTDDEGKTVTAYNLAIASAQAGKRTLLIEGDLRSPSCADYLHLEVDPDAKLEPLSYYGSRSDYLHLVPNVENLYIIPGAGPQVRAAALLESSEMRRLLDDARGRFDLVVIDTPALSTCNDALLLEPLADGITLVTRPGITCKTPLETQLDKMIEAELPLLGAVVNAVDPKEITPLPEDFEDNSVTLPQLGPVNTTADLPPENGRNGSTLPEPANSQQHLKGSRK